MIELVFYIFSGLLLGSAAMVAVVRNPVFAAFFLIAAFFCSAAIWLLLAAEFLALTLLLVYVGAVMVLFLFVVMMLDIDLTVLRDRFARYLPLGAAVAALMAALMVLVLNAFEFGADYELIQQQRGVRDNTVELGRALYTLYLYPFEIAGAILLVAIIAAIALTMRKPRSDKAQQPAAQVAVGKADRLRIVEMPATANKPSEPPPPEGAK